MAELQKETGAFLSERFNYPTDPVTVANLQDRMTKNFPTQLAGIQVRRIIDIDGHKFVMTDGSWIGLRSSGTEPMIRVYVEASDPKRLAALAQAGRDLIDSCRPSKSKKPSVKSKKTLTRAR